MLKGTHIFETDKGVTVEDGTVYYPDTIHLVMPRDTAWALMTAISRQLREEDPKSITFPLFGVLQAVQLNLGCKEQQE